jgi:hypothetical protein
MKKNLSTRTTVPGTVFTETEGKPFEARLLLQGQEKCLWSGKGKRTRKGPGGS